MMKALEAVQNVLLSVAMASVFCLGLATLMTWWIRQGL